jgi:SagB-type dehydrogenase family enzyme
MRPSPHLVAYPEDGAFVLHEYLSGRRARVSPFGLSLFARAAAGRTAAEVVSALPASHRHLAGAALARFVRWGFLRAGRTPAPLPGRERGWDPVAGFFHHATKDLPWPRAGDLEAAERRLRRSARTSPPPPPVKRTARARLRVLPRADRTGEFTSVLLARRTWRAFSRRRLPLEDLSTLLDLTFGVRFWDRQVPHDPVAFKTSPSPGARHCLEAYVLARRVDRLAPGVYHYVSDRHALELVRPGASPALVESCLGRQWWYRPAPAVVFLSAVLPRVRWRYPYARAYRSVLLEAGHFCQTFLLTATWLGLAPFCTAALADSKIERLLRIDGVDEVVLYAAGAGVRPQGAAKAVAWPAHAPGHPFLPPRRR